MPRRLPETDEQWRLRVKNLGLEGKTLFTMPETKSASKIDLPQYLMLGVIYPKPDSSWTLEQLFIKDGAGAVAKENWDAAVTCLDKCEEYKSYIDSIFCGENVLGSFALARLYQMRSSQLIDSGPGQGQVDSSKVTITKRVTRSMTRAQQQQGSPTPKPTVLDLLPATTADMAKLNLQTPKQASGDGSSGSDGEGGGARAGPRYLFSPTSGTPIPPSVADKVHRFIEDEQIVNFALLLLLDALTLVCPAVKGFWSPYRSPFSVRNAGEEVYQARVDGVFRPGYNRPGNMIVEVKPHSRHVNEMDVNMQESAQMAAWIAEYPNLDSEIAKKGRTAGKTVASSAAAAAAKRCYRRALISQNRRDVYVTIGSYDESYVDYITNVSQAQVKSFLTMQRYGPFNICDSSDMEKLSHIMLALCLQGHILNLL